MEIIDLKHYVPDIWPETLKKIAASDDSLKDNYSTIDLSKFITFPCIINCGEIICFSGLQYESIKWGVGIARISSRMWIHPDYRHNSLVKFSGGKKFLNTTYCLPIQFDAAKKFGISTLFVSRQGNRIGLAQYVNLIKINCGIDFTLQEDNYWVCGKQRHHDCIQNVAVHGNKNLWNECMTPYIEKYYFKK